MAKKPILTDEDMDGGLPGGVPTPPRPPEPPGSVTRTVDVPPPPPPTATRIVTDGSGRDASGHARPKTRIHGFDPAPPEMGKEGAMMEMVDEMMSDAAMDEEEAPGAMMQDDKMPAADMAMMMHPTGWLVITAGPGRGAGFALGSGLTSIGAGAENGIVLAFGDPAISAAPHLYVAYDPEHRSFHVAHAGQTELVRKNDAPVLTAEPLVHGDTLRIGATTLRFSALCGPEFDWSDT